MAGWNIGLGWRSLALGMVAALGFALPTVAADRAIIVLDGSGSMWAQIDGKARITIARETLASVLQDLPEGLELGLMTYGHREKGNCDDIEMLVEPGPGTAPAIVAAAEAINPKGKTPISEAVRRAAEALQFTEDKATVILITDGLETCDVDPCALAADLENRGIDFTTHVLGFGLSDEEGQQVACLAENTGGQYLSAQDGDALVDALSTTVAQVTQAEAEPVPEPEPKPEPVAEFNLVPTIALAEGSPDITNDDHDIVWEWFTPKADGTPGEQLDTDYYADFKGNLEPGDYIMKGSVDRASVEQKVTIAAGKVATPHFVVNGTIVKLRPLPSEGAAVDDQATVEIRSNGEYVTTEYGPIDMVLPAGPTEIDFTIGTAKVTRSYDLKAGETVDEDVVIGVGTAKLSAAYVAGMAVESDIFFEILEAKKAIDGTRKSVTYGYGGEQSFELPPGDYVVAYELGGAAGEVPFTVKTAEIVAVPVVLNAGILAVTTPADDTVEVFGAAKSIDGNRTAFDNGFGPEYQTTLPAGDYVVVTSKDGAESETPVTIKAGERFELTVTPKAGKTK